MEDLEEAIICHHQILALRPHDYPDRSDSLLNLAEALFTRFGQSRNNDDLLDAVKYYYEPKNILPTGHPLQSAAGSYLASILLFRCDIFSQLDESFPMMTKAFELYRHAAMSRLTRQVCLR